MESGKKVAPNVCNQRSDTFTQGALHNVITLVRSGVRERSHASKYKADIDPMHTARVGEASTVADGTNRLLMLRYLLACAGVLTCATYAMWCLSNGNLVGAAYFFFGFCGFAYDTGRLMRE